MTEQPDQQVNNLPSEVQALPEAAQQIFQAAFKSAQEDGMDEESARKVAWNTIKSEYRQGENGEWERTPEMINEDNSNPVTRAAVQSGGN
ncbi:MULTISPECIES: ChaB family protein [unclassified Coleofasciculus]|uniref:ChaB family protein n=1 Tax=Cyanophyceae TaxID=3028117 RepID=UPI0016873AC0|nr:MULTISPECIES: ChaB family protein [unclassified Coleofasciculus]MBD1877714.1 ChaB family protein [Coleofasciculus sp. FACHB-T130]MBD1889600.1 ChaB family protein [Coleofasciculus sp. FACHB-SPT9]MBD1894674.1 ChaB family protein [Coleofasciculus sp. FACHB-129]MBD1899510.1 ChaB family protein [Coleofasciculus sp. FACHB-125]MBD2087074.1 ChaB family protein [Coleofasciculus sp. FACHB-542]